ncbi:anaphasepromoting complex subunit 2 isoform 2, putative [Acanthamoeba castellanii str. Neff]|uniref:Anaphase-promoting complex subunit 2 n=1 Tax=Acanthamoeba castellanii (strain ATCC 30010 / Neff) TaxID=1257118 RepID=L8H6T4_ACACF|nr:anaphasepromoting complex subunit 2 isoform 2, putative [Acanthamoeba castellanii str. Neff]ELR20860.1 anaphasepromoting complex subunit 2 isoform 2, putative [Acanthamoeba castellanii str. Neff]
MQLYCQEAKRKLGKDELDEWAEARLVEVVDHVKHQQDVNTVIELLQTELGLSDATHLFARFEIFSQLQLITEKPAIREALFYCLRRRFVIYSSKWIKAHEDEAEDEEADHDEQNGENEEMDYNDGREVNATHGIDALLAMASQEVCEEIVTEVVFEETESRVNSACKAVFDSSVLPSMLRWLAGAALQWMALTLRRPLSSLEQWKARLESHLYQIIATLRTNELFDIIVDYPDSVPALLDLKESLARSDQHLELVSSLTQTGASTNDIIDTYVSTICSLRLLDPTSVLLDAIRPPIAAYLRGRDDTMRCVVSTVTGDTNPELYEELGHAEAEVHDDYDEEENTEPDDDEDIEIADDAARQMDTVSLLVQIYGSDDLFIQEFRTMLASRLLAITDYNTDKDYHNLELLKLRFGETRLHECEIMLQDMSESRRLNTNINKTIQAKAPTGIAFVPSIPSPGSMESYEKEYQAVKASRKLCWRPALGTVEVELEGPHGAQSFSVSPLQAAIIYLFQDQEIWPIEELAEKLGTTSEVVRKGAGYWVANGALRASFQGRSLVYEVSFGEEVNPSGEGVVADEEGEGLAEGDEADEEMWTMLEEFIKAMLMNLERLPADRIQEMLAMTSDSYDKSLSELVQHLQTMIAADVVTLDVDGNYALKRN